jgi:type I restriction enzyme S subunit
MKKYSSYKPSGIEWIGDIPSHWEIKKNKFFTTQQKIKSEKGEEELLSVSEKKGIIPRSEIRNDEQVLSRSESLDGYLIVKKGNLVSNIMLMWKRGLGVSEYNGIVSPAYSVFSFNKSFPKYYHYLFRTDQYVSEFKRNSRGVIESRLRLYDDMFGSIYSHFPPLQEQEQIVNYLDEKTTIIDKLISTKQKKVELLKEQRTTLINQVITKGLNPNVKMKDSGVEWIGEIPDSWNTTKLKHTCEIIYGISPPETTYNDEGLGIELVNGPVEYSKTDFGFTRSLKWTTEPKKFSTKGSLLFCLRGSTTGRMNITHKDLSIGRGVCSINSKGVQWYLIYSMFILRIHIQKQISGSTFPSVVKEDVDNFTICNPPIKEQQEIVEYLDKHTKEIDDLVSMEQNKIELLKEYRQSLISEVITGKIKVFFNKII